MEKNIIKRIMEYFSDEDDLDPTFVRLVRNILVVIIVATFALLIMFYWVDQKSVIRSFMVYLAIGLIIELFTLYSVQRGNLLLAKLLIPIVLLAITAVISLIVNGLRNAAIVAFPITIIVGSILLKDRSRIINVLVLGVVAFIAVKDLRGEIPSAPANIIVVVNITILLLGFIGVTNLLVGRLNQTILKARNSEKTQRVENAELNELKASLEDRVNQRTAELDSANRFNSQRARQFEAIAQVVRAISSIQDLDALLPRITQVVSEQFNTYHTGIFLLDAPREFAVLRASNSEGGQKMLTRRHKLQVAQTGIVGFVTATGQPRIALDVGADAVFFDNPDLPDTRSEIALPLRYAGQVIGALDVQSTESNAFGQEDVEVLVTLADQISVAINNTLILEEARKAFTESQNRSSEAALESWKVMQPKSLGLGFQLVDSSIQLLKKPLEGDPIREAIAQEKSVLSNPGNEVSNLAIPIRLRKQIIGIMNLRSRNNYSFTQDDVDIAEAVSDRLSLAIETATLLQTTQHRADIERVTTDISTKISSSTRFETILQIAAQELSRALGGSDVLVQIEPIASKLSINEG